MSDFDFSKVASVLSLSFETELCEALDWDDEKTNVEMEKLAGYFAVCTKSDPDIVKGDIALICSEEVCVVVNKYLDMATQAMKEYYEKLEENDDEV